MNVQIGHIGINLVLEYFHPEDVQAHFDLIDTILSDLLSFERWGVMGNSVVLSFPTARALISVASQQDLVNVRIIYIPNEIEGDTNPDAFVFKFWTTTERLASLKQKILASLSKKATYTELNGDYGHSFESAGELKDLLDGTRKKLRVGRDMIDFVKNPPISQNPCGEMLLPNFVKPRK